MGCCEQKQLVDAAQCPVVSDVWSAAIGQADWLRKISGTRSVGFTCGKVLLSFAVIFE